MQHVMVVIFVKLTGSGSEIPIILYLFYKCFEFHELSRKLLKVFWNFGIMQWQANRKPLWKLFWLLAWFVLAFSSLCHVCPRCNTYLWCLP